MVPRGTYQGRDPACSILLCLILLENTIRCSRAAIALETLLAGCAAAPCEPDVLSEMKLQTAAATQ